MVMGHTHTQKEFKMSVWTYIKIGLGLAACILVLVTFSGVRSKLTNVIYTANDTIKAKSPFFYNETLALREVNNWREQNGRKPLKIDSRLNRAAQAHADYMAEKDYVGHTSGFWPFSKTATDRVKEAGYAPRALGENVAGGQDSFSSALDSWKNSPGHNRNLLASNATDIGMAVKKNSRGKLKNYWVMVIGSE
jgi:uncharacterized protein YkwD